MDCSHTLELPYGLETQCTLLFNTGQLHDCMATEKLVMAITSPLNYHHIL